MKKKTETAFKGFVHTIIFSGDEVSSTNSKNRVGNSPRHSKLHIAECPVEVTTAGLYNSNVNDSTSIDAEDSADLTGTAHDMINKTTHVFLSFFLLLCMFYVENKGNKIRYDKRLRRCQQQVETIYLSIAHRASNKH